MIKVIIRLVWVVIMTGYVGNITEGRLISHEAVTHDIDLDKIRKRLMLQSTLTLPLEETLTLLDQLMEFELGRFLIKNRGLDGFWTAYVILHGPKRSDLSELERWVLTQAPVVMATQERFKIFQKELQLMLRDGVTIASVPCGLMDDVFGLDYSKVKDVRLVGIDLDGNSLRLAKENALHQGVYDKVKLVQKDAWSLGVENAYDVITSNGLNIYEPNKDRVIALYKEFHKALKAGGVLITSFLTPSPMMAADSPWKNVNKEDAVKQKAIFADIIQAGFQTFWTEKEVREQIESAGFKVLRVVYDRQGMFPTIVCQKEK